MSNAVPSMPPEQSAADEYRIGTTAQEAVA